MLFSQEKQCCMPGSSRPAGSRPLRHAEAAAAARGQQPRRGDRCSRELPHFVALLSGRRWSREGAVPPPLPALKLASPHHSSARCGDRSTLLGACSKTHRGRPCLPAALGDISAAGAVWLGQEQCLEMALKQLDSAPAAGGVLAAGTAASRLVRRCAPLQASSPSSLPCCLLRART